MPSGREDCVKFLDFDIRTKQGWGLVEAARAIFLLLVLSWVSRSRPGLASRLSRAIYSRFIKGLSPSIANKVDLQVCLPFDDVCHLAIKVEKQLKDRKSFQTSPIESPSTNIGIEIPPP